MAGIDHGPGVKAPPPLIFLSWILLAWGLERSWSLPVALSEWGAGLGILLIVLGFGLALTAVYSFWRFHTHIEPWRPASHLITSGVFAYSRNPVYLALIIITLGLGLYWPSVWIMLSAIPAAITVYYLVIVKEERYLTQRFGQPYRDYCQRVRRWL